MNSKRVILLTALLGALLFSCFSVSKARKNKKNNNIIDMLAAGMVAKLLQKQNEDDGGGGGGDHHASAFYPIPIHVPMPSGHASASHRHHHVTEKIIPIPIPHHTTRIIHINADNNEGGQPNGENHPDDDHRDNHDPHDRDPQDHHEQDYRGNSGRGSPSIKQLVFHDNGIYDPNQQQQQKLKQYALQLAATYRRPVMLHQQGNFIRPIIFGPPPVVPAPRPPMVHPHPYPYPYPPYHQPMYYAAPSVRYPLIIFRRPRF